MARLNALQGAMGALGGMISAAQGGPVQQVPSQRTQQHTDAYLNLGDRQQQEQRAHDLLIAQQQMDLLRQEQEREYQQQLIEDQREHQRGLTEEQRAHEQQMTQEQRRHQEGLASRGYEQQALRDAAQHRQNLELIGARQAAAGTTATAPPDADQGIPINDPRTNRPVGHVSEQDFDWIARNIKDWVKQQMKTPGSSVAQGLMDDAIAKKVHDGKTLSDREARRLVDRYWESVPAVRQAIDPQLHQRIQHAHDLVQPPWAPGSQQGEAFRRTQERPEPRPKEGEEVFEKERRPMPITRQQQEAARDTLLRYNVSPEDADMMLQNASPEQIRKLLE